MSPLLIILVYAIPFLAGALFLPLLSYVSKGALWGAISEPIATVQMMAVMIGAGPVVLREQTDGNYRYQTQVDRDTISPSRNWFPFYGSHLGLDYVRDEQSFDGDAEELDGEVYADGDKRFKATDKAAVGSITRADWKTYIPTDVDFDEHIFVPLGEKVSDLRKTASLAISNRAQRNAAEEHSGNTSSLGPKWTVISMISMAVICGAFGILVFYT